MTKQNNELLTLEEAGRFLKVHPETIRRWHLRHGLKSLKAGRILRFRKEDLLAYLERGPRS